MKTASVKEIKRILMNVKDEHDPLIAELATDTRKGVIELLDKWRRARLQEKQDWHNYQSMTQFEQEARIQGYQYIAGIDEAGRGPLAGPVVSAAVILHENSYFQGLNDSKKINEQKRKELYRRIMDEAIAVGIGIISAEEIDRLNIYEATKKSMREAIQNLSTQPDYLLIDAVNLKSIYPENPIIKGDARSVSIAAASIIAKVTRDQIMKEYHHKYPDYGFNVHMGYGTKIHLEAIKTFGPCSIHRKTFAPLKTMP
ncbi:ribonuclease HII [Lederbergia citrea]|uniref:Ribonuclease HII n=1 Tax=Lederbergia citrea TaxID=2833581 RepID=A0A942ULS7_9BACI|nr:ribonuclease HII [Lederbergia citrea]MBS4177140.1 ribonuclease HII [Lederbergia citrea]MBS4203803.1 ribonuclease HII [Lederbergia citrea]MBS4221612.1 ribonuclease HII [Lederbergia citrea]